MPIAREHRWLYPIDWRELSALVRFDRARSTCEHSPVIEMSRRAAELTKYADNAFLATRITFINEIADLCEKVGADVQDVAYGIGLDNSIGSKFLHAGPGYGGSCFPKDTLALLQTAQDCEALLPGGKVPVDLHNVIGATQWRRRGSPITRSGADGVTRPRDIGGGRASEQIGIRRVTLRSSPTFALYSEG